MWLDVGGCGCVCACECGCGYQLVADKGHFPIVSGEWKEHRLGVSNQIHPSNMDMHITGFIS